jgi:hypothetical protein
VLNEKQEGPQDEERSYISPSGSSVTRRRGYQALPAEEPGVPGQDSADDEEQDLGERYDIAESWKILGSSFAASALLTVRMAFRYDYAVLLTNIPTLSSQHISFPLFSIFRYSVSTLLVNGFGIFLPVSHT